MLQTFELSIVAIIKICALDQLDKCLNILKKILVINSEMPKCYWFCSADTYVTSVSRLSMFDVSKYELVYGFRKINSIMYEIHIFNHVCVFNIIILKSAKQVYVLFSLHMCMLELNYSIKLVRHATAILRMRK